MKRINIEKLKKILEKKSVNELFIVDRNFFITNLKLSDNETNKVIEWLLDKKFMVKKYEFKCDCGFEKTIYDNYILLKSRYVCEGCDKLFDLNGIKNSSKLIYEIDKTYFMKCFTENEFKKDVDNNIVKFTKNRENSNMKEEKVKIFIGSSKEAIKIMDDTALELENLEVIANRWDSIGTFEVGNYTLDSLINIANSNNGAIFIFAADDKIWVNGDENNSFATVRDNVIFEYGLFMGLQGKNNVCIISPDDIKMPSDLKGLTYIKYDSSKKTTFKKRIEGWIKNIENN